MEWSYLVDLTWLKRSLAPVVHREGHRLGNWVFLKAQVVGAYQEGVVFFAEVVARLLFLFGRSDDVLYSLLMGTQHPSGPIRLRLKHRHCPVAKSRSCLREEIILSLVKHFTR